MQSLTDYQDLIADLKTFFQGRIAAALELGIPKNHLILDPGIGFAKTALQNYDLIRQLQDFRDLGYPLLVGPSVKALLAISSINQIPRNGCGGQRRPVPGRSPSGPISSGCMMAQK